MLCRGKLQKKSVYFVLLLTDENGETSTNFRVRHTIRVFISLLIYCFLCAQFYSSADTLFATVDPSPQKSNIKVGRKIAHLI